jgi:CheY-like chemotaxis protein
LEPEKKKILVMDDEEMIGDVACQIIEIMGLDAVWVADGMDAVQEYKKQLEAKQPFAAVIMDLSIPGGMGGKEAVEKILELDNDAKVYVSSGHASHPVITSFEKYGFLGVLAKPFDFISLQETLSPFLPSANFA